MFLPRVLLSLPSQGPDSRVTAFPGGSCLTRHGRRRSKEGASLARVTQQLRDIVRAFPVSPVPRPGPSQPPHACSQGVRPTCSSAEVKRTPCGYVPSSPALPISANSPAGHRQASNLRTPWPRNKGPIEPPGGKGISLRPWQPTWGLRNCF